IRTGYCDLRKLAPAGVYAAGAGHRHHYRRHFSFARYPERLPHARNLYDRPSGPTEAQGAVRGRQRNAIRRAGGRWKVSTSPNSTPWMLTIGGSAPGSRSYGGSRSRAWATRPAVSLISAAEQGRFSRG